MTLLRALVRLGRTLPPETTEALAAALEQLPGQAPSALPVELLELLVQPRRRTQFKAILERWREEAPNLSPSAVATGLRAAAVCDAEHRREQQIDLVWTGPPSVALGIQRIDQSLLSLIEEARSSLLLVTFAAYRAEAIRRALLGAVERGVALRLIVELPEAEGGKVRGDPRKAFGEELSQRAQVYTWPLEKRPRDERGSPGGLHAKCAVADDEAMLLSSANITGHAMELNMELGLLVRGNPLVRRVSEHFRELIRTGTLSLLAPDELHTG